jgi:glycosyltransferase involved in cell wall biosynthesis
MTVTEAAACGTPAVATRIAGHVDAVHHDVSGLLVDSVDDFGDTLGRVIGDASLRKRLAKGAKSRSDSLTWEATAAGTLEVLVEEAESKHRPRVILP